MIIAAKEALLAQLRRTVTEPEMHAWYWPEATLVYGYTVERDTFHVYRKGDLLHRVVYRPHVDGSVTVIESESAESFPVSRMTPSKGIYWPHSNYAFLSDCARLGAYVHLKDSETATKSPYHGHVEN